MRAGALAVVALVAALVGGAAALIGGRAAGWVGSGTTETVAVTTTRVERAPASPAAVRVSARPLPGNGFSPARIYAERATGVVTIYSFFGSDADPTQEAQGSGFVVSASGYILTNSHVITNAGAESGQVSAADSVYVEFADGDRVPARVVGWDLFDDVGLIAVAPKEHALAPVPLGDSANVVVGEPVAAIGSPFGNEDSLAAGIVSATHRSIRSLTSRYNVVDAIQIDAPINHGNSGGPLFDARGRVIGINAQIRSESGNAEGVGFAIPINAAKRSMRELISHGRVDYAYVGIATGTLTPSVARRFAYPVEHGAVVSEVRSGTPGAKAGLRAGSDVRFNGDTVTRGGDVIVAINGDPVTSADDVVRIVAERLRPGEVATFTLYRGRERRTVSLRLTRRPV